MFKRLKQNIYQYERLLFPCGFSNHTQAAIFSFFEKERKLIGDNIRDFVPLDEENNKTNFFSLLQNKKKLILFKHIFG